MRRVIALVACAACGRVGFDAFDDGGHSGDDDGSGSGSGSGSGMDLSSTCLSPGYGDPFDEITPCMAFGQPMVDNGGLSTSGGTLTIAPNAGANTMVGCMRQSAAYGVAGEFVEVSQVVPDPGQTILLVQGLAKGASMFTQPPFLIYFELGGGTVMKNYDPVAMRWWRIRPNNTLTGTLAETSPDGRTWTQFAATSTILPANVAVEVYVQTDSSNPAPGTATIEGIDVCPPP